MARSAPKKEVRRPPSSESSEPEDEDVQDFQDAEDDVEMASADEHEEQEPASDDASDSDAPKIPVIPVALKPKKEKAPRKRKDSPASDEEAPKRKRRARTAKDPGAPKKPNSAYTLFVKENHPAVKKRMAEKMGEEKGRLQTEIMKELGRMWGALSAEEKKPYEIEAAQAQADFKVAQSQYVESGAKTAWDAAHKSADPKAKAGAAAKPGAVPATPLPAGTGELHHLLHQFHTEEGLDKLDDIRAAIAALSEPLKRAVAEESLAGIIQVKADRLKVKEAQLMKTLTEALVGNGGDSNNPSPAPGSGKAKREKKPVGEMTEKAKHRKAQSAWRKHLQIEYNFPKNPETSYLIFRNKHQPAIREDIVKKNPEMTTVSMKIVSDAVAAKWKNLSESEKAVYEKEAEKKKKEHEKAIEDWKRKYPHLSLEVSEEDVDKFAMKEERGRKRKSVGGAGESEEEKEASPEPEEEPVKDKGKKKDKVEKKDEKKEVVAPAPAPVKEDKKKGKEVKEDRSKAPSTTLTPKSAKKPAAEPVGETSDEERRRRKEEKRAKKEKKRLEKEKEKSRKKAKVESEEEEEEESE